MTTGVTLPGVSYRQGSRLMVVTAMEPIALVRLVTRPDTWNPLGDQSHGNRPQDKKHRAGIREYIENEEEWVLGAVVLYASPRDASFQPAEGADDASVSAGLLTLSIGAEFDVGDGQHRIGGLSDVIKAHNEDGDAVIERLRKAGMPAVVVIDDVPLHRAQDYTDLQRNVKPPTSSLSMSMDRRQAINRFMVELVQRPDVPLFDKGDRIEFLKDNPGKLSAKLFSFKTVRYLTGTVFIGVSQRTSAGWEKAGNEAVDSDWDVRMSDAVELWKAFGTLPGITEVLSGKLTPAKLRERSLLMVAGVEYAIAYAVYLAHEEDKVSYGDGVRALAKVNFDRPRLQATDPKPSEDNPITASETIFAGTLIDSNTGKVGSGRPAWEAAGEALRKVIVTGS